MYQIRCLSALCTVARNKDERLRHDFTQYLSHLRISRTYDRADVAVLISHALSSPLGNLLTYELVERTAIDQLILELAAGWIGCLYENEESLLFSLAHLEKRLDAIRAEVWIHGRKVLAERSCHHCADLHLTKMCCCISCGGRADIPTLHITDHNESFFVAVVHRSLKSCKTRNSELLIHRNLRLHCRDQIIYFIYNRLIVLPYSLGRTFQRLAIFLKCSCLYLFRNIGKHRIESDYDRCICLLYICNQFLNHRFSPFRFVFYSSTDTRSVQVRK